ncbi:MAG: nucleoside monophosphate kinase [bacterium]
MKFPIFKTKIRGGTRVFDLNNPKEREAYFKAKAGKEIEKLKSYFKGGNSFVAYLMGKKSSGKGTYAKLFAEAVGAGYVEHFSVGDMIRGIDRELADPKKKKELTDFLKNNYRGWRTLKDLLAELENRSTATLLPTDLILALVKREIGKRKKKTIFIDGFPRDLDQINFTLFFRDLIGYRQDPDIFVLISVPGSVIDERIKHRRVCPLCQTSRNYKLLPTSKIDYDKKEKKFYLLCDNPECPGARMVEKEGDKAGIKPIKERLKKDEKLIEQAAKLYGIPKVFLRNSLPCNLAKKYVDEYEITPEYVYCWSEAKKRAEIKEKPWVVKDDHGQPSYSLLAAPVTLALIKQITKELNL